MPATLTSLSMVLYRVHVSLVPHQNDIGSPQILTLACLTGPHFSVLDLLALSSGSAADFEDLAVLHCN